MRLSLLVDAQSRPDLVEHTTISVAMIVLYIRVCFITVKQQRGIHTESTEVQPFRNGQEPTTQDVAGIESGRRNRKRWIKELKAVRMTVALAVLYVFISVPYFVVSGLMVTGSLTYFMIVGMTSTIGALNVTLNWLLYALISKKYMKA